MRNNPKPILRGVILLPILWSALTSCTPIDAIPPRSVNHRHAPHSSKYALDFCIYPGVPCNYRDDNCCDGYTCMADNPMVETGWCVEDDQSHREPFIRRPPGPIAAGKLKHIPRASDKGNRPCIRPGRSCHPRSKVKCCPNTTCHNFGKESFCVKAQRIHQRSIDNEEENTESLHDMSQPALDMQTAHQPSMHEHGDSNSNTPTCHTDEDCHVFCQCLEGICTPKEDHDINRTDIEKEDEDGWETKLGENKKREAMVVWQNFWAGAEGHENTKVNRRAIGEDYAGKKENEEVKEEEKEVKKDKKTGEEEEEKPPFPSRPTAGCTQEGCPCYYNSPCEMGVCDDYDERLIGKCRNFRPGEGNDLQPGFPIDTHRCTYTGCPCNKWWDHCFKGACDNLNRAGYGRCRPFRPTEEPRVHRKPDERCNDVGCVCDDIKYPCKDSKCVTGEGNKFGRCRRLDSAGKTLYTRQVVPDPNCKHEGCPCRGPRDCYSALCVGERCARNDRYNPEKAQMDIEWMRKEAHLAKAKDLSRAAQQNAQANEDRTAGRALYSRQLIPDPYCRHEGCPCRGPLDCFSALCLVGRCARPYEYGRARFQMDIEMMRKEAQLIKTQDFPEPAQEEDEDHTEKRALYSRQVVPDPNCRTEGCPCHEPRDCEFGICLGGRCGGHQDWSRINRLFDNKRLQKATERMNAQEFAKAAQQENEDHITRKALYPRHEVVPDPNCRHEGCPCLGSRHCDSTLCIDERCANTETYQKAKAKFQGDIEMMRKEAKFGKSQDYPRQMAQENQYYMNHWVR